MNTRSRIATALAVIGLAAGASTAAAGGFFNGYIQSPTGNILCALDSGGTWCSVGNLKKEVTLSTRGVVTIKNRTNADIGDVKIRTLPYGEEVDSRWNTCVSRKSGMFCYSRATGKGVLMNRSGITKK